MYIKEINKSYKNLTIEDKEYIKRVYYENKLSYLEMEKLLKISHRALKTTLKDFYGINTRLKNRYTVNSKYFNKIENEKQAYILGFICADGYVGDKKINNVVISSKDKHILDEIKKELQFTGDIRETKPGGFEGSKKGYSLNFSDKQIATDLRNLGILPNKSLTFDKILNIRKDLKKHFLRGYFDGDGSISYNLRTYVVKGKKYKYHRLTMTIIGTELFLRDVMRTFNIKDRKLAKSKTNQMKYLCISSKKELLYLYDLMYEDATISLNRKREIWEKNIRSL